MKNVKSKKRKKYGVDFLLMFIAVVAGFALNNWTENRRDGNAESKIMAEIYNGLKKDIDDIRINKAGHMGGMKACDFWRDLVEGRDVKLDSISQHYFDLTRDYISIQNVSGYETLKSRGLELVDNDSLRAAIISIYEYDYSTLRKLEEEYNEMQFQRNYFKEINSYLAPSFMFDEKGHIVNIDLPLNLSESERKIMLTYLWKIQVNRNVMLGFYSDIEDKVNDVLKKIEKEQY